jgi:pyruvate ferredoxin oxidoreductase gamma subunit
VIEIRWHGRAGQGAKTASMLLATAELRAGRQGIQAFPDYGPERSGAPMRAYNRIDDRPVRRRYSVVNPDAVVVLDPSLLHEAPVTEGLADSGLLVVNSEQPAREIAAELGFEGEVVCIAGTAIAAGRGSNYVNLVMLGALAAALGEPPLEDVLAVAREHFRRKLLSPALDEVVATIAEGHDAAVTMEVARG